MGMVTPEPKTSNVTSSSRRETTSPIKFYYQANLELTYTDAKPLDDRRAKGWQSLYHRRVPGPPTVSLACDCHVGPTRPLPNANSASTGGWLSHER